MQLSFARKTSDNFGRYYTDRSIAGLLIESMQIDSPRTAIDLGAGGGALVTEASFHWPRTNFITVDIDQSALSSSLASRDGSSFTHHRADALAPSIAEKLGIKFGEVDSGLCNPPYIRPRWRRHFGEILEDAGLSSVVPKIGCIPADILFLAQNLRFLKDSGKLGLILPDGVIAGEKYAKLRMRLATAHRIERVIELPRRIFSRTDAKAHIVVLAKRAKGGTTIPIQCVDADGLLSDPINLSAESAGQRLDYSYLISRHAIQSKSVVPLRSIVKLIARGSYSSAERRVAPYPIFHTTDFEQLRTVVHRRHYLNDESRSRAVGKVAQRGDILLARVGRNLESKVCVVGNGSVAVSDCVLILRVEPQFQARAVEYLTSSIGRKALAAASHGVGAKFITTEALLNICINV